MLRAALIVIYNHQYNQNIEVIEQIYKNRFRNIRHLVPFYNGTKSNVISVYESSYYFQGYISQGLKSFFSQDIDHYIFISDDLILNPQINEENYSQFFKLNAETCFIPGLKTLHEDKGWWSKVKEAFDYNAGIPGVEVRTILPDYENALKIFNTSGLTISPLSFSQIWKKPESVKEFFGLIFKDRKYLYNYIQNIFIKKKYNLPYPMVGSYSDISVVSSKTIKQFCHYSGIFATTKLFVEFGLPTAMVLSAQEIITEKELQFQGRALWSDEELKSIDKYDRNLNKLLSEFPEDLLYLHPVKLSEWRASF